MLSYFVVVVVVYGMCSSKRNYCTVKTCVSVPPLDNFWSIWWLVLLSTRRDKTTLYTRFAIIVHSFRNPNCSGQNQTHIKSNGTCFQKQKKKNRMGPILSPNLTWLRFQCPANTIVLFFCFCFTCRSITGLPPQKIKGHNQNERPLREINKGRFGEILLTNTD